MAKGHKHDCVGEYMHRWKRGQLHSGTGKSGKLGPKVTSQQQAIAIGMSVCNNTEGTSDFGSGCGCGGGGPCTCPARTMPNDLLKRRQSMLALGYSEEAVDKVLSFCEGKTTGMVKSRLSVIIGRATELLDVIESVEASGATVEMEPWMIDKLTMAADYLSAAADNARYGDGVDAVYGEKKGLWDNIHAKRKRIKAGSGERMRKPGSPGAPSAQDLKDSQEDDD